MDTKFKIILAIVALSAVQATCKKNCMTATYSFKIGVRATPNLDSILIGDTIWLDINEPTSLNDIPSGALIDYSNATYLGSNIGFQEVLSATQFRNAANDFNFKLISGTETPNTNPQLFRAYLFAEQNNRYVFKLGVIPKTVGVYRLVLGNAANVSRNNSNCERASFQIDFQQTDQHFYFFPGGAGTPPGGGAYYFKVK
ncbi:MAG TPA: hypothetical protein VK483_17630 [Chitinophagaceae bacterium]|nr:hypothetical protein [Chitinophagaceae bacterium]